MFNKRISELKICFIAGMLAKGGSERQLYNMVNLLNRNKVKVIVLCLTQEDDYQKKIEDLGINVFYVGKKKSKLYRVWKIRQIIKKFKPDIVQSSHFYTNLYVFISTLFLKCRRIGAIRSDFFSEIKSLLILGPLSARFPKIKIANSIQAINNMKKYKIDITDTYYLPNAVDISLFKKNKQKTVKKKKLRILSVGNFKFIKRYDILLRALCELYRGGFDFEAFLVGSYTESTVMLELKRLTKKLKIPQKKIKFIIEKNDIFRYYNSADIFVLTSDYEGMPNVVLEAMSFGLPIVSTNAGAASDIIENKESGFIVPIGDYQKIAKKIGVLLKDAKLRKKMGEKGRKIIEKEFSLNCLEKRILKIYSDILKLKNDQKINNKKLLG